MRRESIMDNPIYFLKVIASSWPILIFKSLCSVKLEIVNIVHVKLKLYQALFYFKSCKNNPK